VGKRERVEKCEREMVRDREREMFFHEIYDGICFIPAAYWVLHI